LDARPVASSISSALAWSSLSLFAPGFFILRRSASTDVLRGYLPLGSLHSLQSHEEADATQAILVYSFASNRLRSILLALGLIVLALPQFLRAQEDATDTPLGDIARSLRKKTAPVDSGNVIDNDNLPQVVDEAESRRLTGSTPVFSLDPGAKSFHVSSPDVSCSLSFTAKNSSLSDPLLLNEMPRSELAKLDGPATIDGDSLQVSVRNGTLWDLREIVIGLTIVKRPDPVEANASYGQARIVPASANSLPQQDSTQKQPDVTLLLKVKGSAAPSTTAVFRAALNFALFPDQDWHWAIVKAKGIPPQSPPVDLTAAPPLPAAAQSLPGSLATGTRTFPTLLPLSNSSLLQQSAPAH